MLSVKTLRGELATRSQKSAWLKSSSWSGENTCWMIAYFVLCTLVLSCGLGCGSSSGHASESVVFNEASVQFLSIEPGLEQSKITIKLSSEVEEKYQFRVEYSEDRGLNFVTATVDFPADRRFESSSAGRTHEVYWRTSRDLTNFQQADLVLRLSLVDSQGIQGTQSLSSVFSLGSNTPPQITQLVSPTGTVGGQVPFSYTVKDEQADHVAIQIEYSVDLGANWKAGSIGSQGDSGESVSTSVVGDAHQIYWWAQIDEPGLVSSNILVRITPSDISTGLSAQALTFSVNLIAPDLNLLSLGAIPEHLNGSQSYHDSVGTVQQISIVAPPYGFEIVAQYEHYGSSYVVSADNLMITANQDLGEYSAGDNLAELFTVEQEQASWIVPEAYQPSTDAIRFEAQLTDNFGNLSEKKSFSCTLRTPHAAELPFDVVDRWFLNFDSDLFSITHSGVHSIVIDSIATPNGKADFQEDLVVIGLRSENPSDASAAIGSNAIVERWLREQIIGHLRLHYGANFDGDTEPTFANGGIEFTDDPSTGYRSSIRIGGDDHNAGFTLGRAHFDHKNAYANANGGSNLGVFGTNLIAYYINSSSTFKSRFDPMISGRGVPIGVGVEDHLILAEDFVRLDPGNPATQNDRYDELWTAIDAYARIIALITAHEMGHSMGLCSNGPLPHGLFGGVTSPDWGGGSLTNSFHFDSAGNNIMAAGISFYGSQITGSSRYQFNEVNKAYLQEHLILTD